MRSLQHGLTVGRAYVKVDDTSNIPVQIANFSDRDIYLKPKMIVGRLENVAIEPRVGLCFGSKHEVCVEKRSLTVPARMRLSQIYYLGWTYVTLMMINASVSGNWFIKIL